MRRLTAALVVAGLTGMTTAALAAPAHAADIGLWGVQPSTGNIVKVDPATGATLASFPAPDGLGRDAVHVGLTGVSGQTLAYTYDGASDDVLTIDVTTGAVTNTFSGDGFENSGLSYQTDRDGSDLLFSSHRAFDHHRQVGFGGPVALFWEGVSYDEASGGVGGDNMGREFGATSVETITEYNPYVDDETPTNTIPAPEGLRGLAFDGLSLYGSSDNGRLHTIDPDTGAVLNTVPVEGGPLMALGVLAPGPTPVIPEGKPVLLALLGVGAALATVARTRRIA